MPIDPNIPLSGNQMAPVQLPDVNAMMQTRTAGLENMYKLNRQQQQDAAAAQKAQADAALKAMSPAVAAAFTDPSDAGLDAALALVPAQFRDAAKAQLDQVRALPDVSRRKDLIRSALVQDDYGRALLAQLEPTASARLQADLERQRLDIERQKLTKGDTAKWEIRETDQGLVRINPATGEVAPLQSGDATLRGAPKAETQMTPYQQAQLAQEERKLQVAQEKETAEQVKARLAAEKRAQETQFAIKEIESSIAPGGLLDKATGSLFGNWVRDTAAQAFGYGTEGAIANAQMKPIADLALKLVPRFEGPQSDKDTQSYKDAAGDLANPSLPTSVKKAAANKIVELLKRYPGQLQYGGGEGAAAPSGSDVDTSNPLLQD